MVARVADILLPADTHANRPAAAAVPVGAVFPCTTHGTLDRNNGSTWDTWATLVGAGVDLADLGDVDLTGQADGDFLSRVGGIWTPVDAPSGGGSAGLSPDDIPGSPGAIDYEFNATSASFPSGWGWGTQNSAVWAEGKGRGSIVTPATTGIRSVVRNVPAGTSWTVEAKLRGAIRIVAGAGFGLCLFDSVSGKYVIQPYDGRGCGWAYFSNATTYGGTEAGYNSYFGWGDELYFRIEKNSASSYDFSWSSDGLGWLELFTAVNVGSFFTPDKIGFFVQPGGSTASSVACEWLRQTA